jgi:hypothetical protein
MMETPQRPVARVGDRLDSLLDLLDRARTEQHLRQQSFTAPDVPYRRLLTAVFAQSNLAHPT